MTDKKNKQQNPELLFRVSGTLTASGNSHYKRKISSHQE